MFGSRVRNLANKFLVPLSGIDLVLDSNVRNLSKQQCQKFVKTTMSRSSYFWSMLKI